MSTDYRKTKWACYLGYVTQAITANFAPLLFVTFHRQYGIPLSSLALIPAVFYVVQLCVDFLCAKFSDINYRRSIILSEVTSAAGLLGLTVLPGCFSNPLVGILLCVALYAVGSGLIEVLGSPIIEACPFPDKESMMSLLHSFYCWGAVGVILGSTLFFSIFGVEHWHWLVVLWSLVPLLNIYNFSTCPIDPIVPDGEGKSMGQMLRKRIFWLFFLLMIAAGASESSMAQWTSAFAEASLHVDKATGDLFGPCGFAFCMGLGRLWYGKRGEKVDLAKFMMWSGLLCLIGYLTAALSPLPHLALAGCMLSGLSVGIMWPGTISLSVGRMKGSGTALFALLALAGDVGGTLGPSLVGIFTGNKDNNIGAGILSASIFPLLLCLALVYFRMRKSKQE